MASETYLHIGLPKTGTTYLQSVLWGSREQLLADGWLLPGARHREHLWAALDLQERPNLAARHPAAPGSLARLLAEVRAHPGPAVLTHEFFCGAGRRQVGRLIEALESSTVHVVITARDTLSMLTSGWIEYIKNGGTLALSELEGDTLIGRAEFGWRTWDLSGVLRRWTPHLPPEQVHILTMPPPGSPHDQHWRTFATVLGLDPARYDAPDTPRNAALGVVEVELLRRINLHLEDFHEPVDRGTWIRGFLAEGHLVRPGGERVVADPAQVAECAVRADRAIGMIERLGFDVHGDLDSLRVPEAPRAGRRPDDVAGADLVDSASRLAADMLTDIRRLSRTGPSPVPGAST